MLECGADGGLLWSVSVGMGRLKVAAARSRAGAARLKPRKLAGTSLRYTVVGTVGVAVVVVMVFSRFSW
ncbi:Uncharacterised protein [Mycolicibacterium gilvum]|uniref:Transmembrane protein n=1 Tax=Mycolicibacterium gilvum TaxID=1804 RepID=A0A379MMF1_9MYCO|nr:Uncharacterised protein [Mycolicibacterium gilvum]